MRNLKRVLALALALIMTLGLMITASAASYPDADQIDAKYTEAVEVLSGLGVFKGQGNGGTASFAPKAVLTRGEAATLVYRILTGDVTDAQVRNYDYTSFEDVLEGQWWTGYITYSANGGYVKGYDGRFNPQDEVTGVQVLAIMLRAIGRGQNGEYEGAAWKDNVLTDARDLGLLKGIATDDLDKGAARELVAQLLFNAITIPNIVTYSALMGYQQTPEKQTLGNKVFALTEINGVVTANEYADLYGTTPLAKGKTEINGVTYNTTTTLEDIGETHRGWATGKDVLYFVKTGTDTIFETGAATKLGKDFKKATGLTSTDDTEYFLNFGHDGTYDSDYRIEFAISFDDADVEKGFEKDYGVDVSAIMGDPVDDLSYEKVIRAGATITDDDLAIIRGIFAAADDDDDSEGIQGAVYVGTKSVDTRKDLSDSISYKTFKADYINDETYGESFDSTVNGEWLKVIDNDGDGKADYVLKTEFFIDQVYDISKKGEITLVNKEEAGKNESYVAYDDIAEGDVVISTALIDGNYYLTEAETFEGVVTTVSYKNESITVDGEEYFQSEIDSDAYVAALDMFEDIQDADEKTEYIFYTDLFGYVRAYTYVDTSTSYGLLTEAYVDQYFNGKYVKKNVGIAEVTIGDAKTAEYIVTNLGTSNKNLNPFFTDFDNDPFDAELVPALIKNSDGTGDTVTSTTNIAKYSGLTEDEITLKTAEQRGTGLKTLEIVELDNTKNVTAKARSYDAVNGKYVSANKDTEYYFVYVENSIAYRVGYSEVPAIKAENITAAYALTQVTTNDSTATKEYGVAKVIVFETNINVVRSAEDTILAYYNTSKTTSKVQAIDSILGTGTLSTVYEDNTWYDSKFDEIAFYDTYAGKNENVTLDKITENFASYRIYAGVIDRIEGLDYIKVDLTTAGATLDLDLTETKAPVYVLNNSKKDVVTAEEITLTAKKNTGDEIIWVENKKGEVIYVVDVTKSIDAATNDTFTDVEDLYNAIMTEATAPTSYEAAVKKAENALAANPQVKTDLEAAKTALNALNPKDLTATELLKVQELVEDIDDALAQIKDDADLRAAKDKAIADLKDAIVNAVKTEAATQNVTVVEANILTDTTKITVPTGWTPAEKYESVAAAVTTWVDEIEGVNSTTDPNLTAVIRANHPATLAAAYVNAVAAEQQTDSFKKLANGKAEKYLEQIKTQLASAITWTTGDTVKGLVETEINKVTPEGNPDEYTYTVTAPTDVSFVGNTGTKTVTVNVSVTNSYAGVVSDAQSADIVVTFSW